METIACTVCGTQNNPVLFEGQDEWFGLPGSFPVRHCQTCGLFYLSPRPTTAEIGRYYPPAYTPYLPAIEDEPSAWVRFNRQLAMSKRLKLIQQHIQQPGQVLDVGCATGNLLAALQQAGWQPHGVETNSQAADYTRQRFGIPVFTGELQQAQLPASQFDLVIFWDVLEHVHDPRQVLQEAARITRSGGTLLLSLPNPGSLEARLFGSHWAGWDIPRHLQLFPVAVIDRLLQETDWQMVDWRCAGGRMWLFNLSLQHWLKARRPGWQKVLMPLMRSPFAQLLFWPYFELVERIKKGAVMAIFATRC